MFRSEQNGKITFNISSLSACPCGSGAPLFMCCQTVNGLHKTASVTTPRFPKTNHSKVGCYASCLNDCSEVLSREHFISKSLLEYLNSSNSLKIGGFPWLNETEKCLPPDAIASKILCQRHNSALAVLDRQAIRFFSSCDVRGTYYSDQKSLFLFNGHDFERWLLKILCGQIYSGNYHKDVRGEVNIPIEWIEILFGHREFRRDQGLYVCNDNDHSFHGEVDIGTQVISNKDGISGIGVSICGFEFILSMSGASLRRFDGRRFTYRPIELYTQGLFYEKSIVFSWDGHTDGGIIGMDLIKNAR